MSGRCRVAVVSVVALVVFWAAIGGVSFAGSSWTTYHLNPARTGNDTSEPGLLPIRRAWSAALDGKVYAQPLVLSGRVIAATENDTVYALDGHDGHVLWSLHIGTPVTNVVAQVGCGNIDPLGITSTPVIDAATNTVFAVGAIQDANQVIHHQLVGIDVSTGALRFSVNADPGGVQNPLYIQQRAGLALGNGRVYVGYGGYAGDCGPYHGWLVSLTETGTDKLAFNTTPNTGEGAIWAPSGPAIGGSGYVYVATGNPNAVVSTGDYGESVLRFDPTLHLLANFSQTNATGDTDVGSVGPALVSGSMLFQIGKQQVGYLLDRTSLSLLQSMQVCPTQAFGGTAFDGTHLYVPCREHIREVNIDATNRSMSLGWTGPTVSSAGPPILAGGLLWTIDIATATLYALNPSTGATVTTFALGTVPHFASPTAALGLLLIGTNAGVTALDGPAGPPQPALAPSAPTGVSATPGNTAATVHWTAPANTNGSQISGYTVTPFIGGTAQTQQRHTFMSTATTQTIGFLTNADTYTFKVAATNGNGTGPQSVASAPITVGAPIAPTAATATAQPGAATLQWTAPSKDNGSAVVGYVVTPYVGFVAQDPVPFNSAATSQTISGLTPGTTYRFKVAAKNARGIGPQSTASNAVTPT